jgi:hypothetical protein
MKPIIIKVEGVSYLNWNEKLYRLIALSGKYRSHYGEVDHLLEFEDEFSYEEFKNLKGIDIPDNLCIASYCSINLYRPVHTINIIRSDANLTCRLTNCYDLREWKYNYQLGKFCEKLWESFTLAGFEIGEKPKLEETAYFITVSKTLPIEVKIQDVVEAVCNKLSEVHNSLLNQVTDYNPNFDAILNIIEKKIDLYFKPSLTDMGFKTGRLISNLKPPEFKNIGIIINDFTSIVATTIDAQMQKIIEIIKTTINESKIQFNEELKNSISDLCKYRINEKNYIKRFSPFIDSIERHCLRYGSTRFDKTDNSINLLAAKFEALIKTKVRSCNENIKTELNIISFANKFDKNSNAVNKDEILNQNKPISSSDIWKLIQTDYDITKRSLGKKINFVKDQFKRKVIFRDIEHAYILAFQGYPKPSVILAGSVIEELLRLYLNHKEVSFKTSNFDSYIKACEENDLLKKGISRLSDSVRHFRNMVHLQKETTPESTITKVTAKGAVASIFTIANDF